MKKIRVAQIGVGHDHAFDIFKNVSNLTDVFEVAGYALPDDEKEKFIKIHKI